MCVACIIPMLKLQCANWFELCGCVFVWGNVVRDSSTRLRLPLSKSLQTLEVKYGSDQTAGWDEAHWRGLSYIRCDTTPVLQCFQWLGSIKMELCLSGLRVGECALGFAWMLCVHLAVSWTFWTCLQTGVGSTKQLDMQVCMTHCWDLEDVHVSSSASLCDLRLHNTALCA